MVVELWMQSVPSSLSLVDKWDIISIHLCLKLVGVSKINYYIISIICSRVVIIIIIKCMAVLTLESLSATTRNRFVSFPHKTSNFSSCLPHPPALLIPGPASAQSCPPRWFPLPSQTNRTPIKALLKNFIISLYLGRLWTKVNPLRPFWTKIDSCPRNTKCVVALVFA